MNKKIAGSVYNTETAKEIGFKAARVPQSDFSYWEETLYRTKAGKYFLHGEGGPMTRYADVRGQESGWGEQIIPLSPESAQKWAEEHLDAHQVIAAFGAHAEIDTAVSVFLPPELVERLDATPGSRAEIISAALKAYLK